MADTRGWWSTILVLCLSFLRGQAYLAYGGSLVDIDCTDWPVGALRYFNVSLGSFVFTATPRVALTPSVTFDRADADAFPVSISSLDTTCTPLLQSFVNCEVFAVISRMESNFNQQDTCELSVYWFVWDEHNSPAMVGPSTLGVEQATVAYDTAGPYAILSSVRINNPDKGPLVANVAAQSTQYVEFNIADASYEYCPDGCDNCEHNGQPVQDCELGWSDVVQVDYCLFQAPITLSPTLSLSPTPFSTPYPTNVPTFSPNPSPTPHPTLQPTNTSGALMALSSVSACQGPQGWQTYREEISSLHVRWMTIPANTNGDTVVKVDIPLEELGNWSSTSSSVPGIMVTPLSYNGDTQGTDEAYVMSVIQEPTSSDQDHRYSIVVSKIYPNPTDFTFDHDVCAQILVYNFSKGDECSEATCVHGECYNGECKCDVGYLAESSYVTDDNQTIHCIDCVDGFYGSNGTCMACPGYSSITKDVCYGHGNCTATGNCECEEGYSGHDCSKCSPGFFQYGANETLYCLACQSSNNDTCSGNGFCNLTTHQCTCEHNFQGAGCGLCNNGYTGKSCELMCDHLCGGIGNCSVTKSHLVSETMDPTHTPTAHPSHTPTPKPTHKPTLHPTHLPIPFPTSLPIPAPTHNPSPRPSTLPTTSRPTDLPSFRPSHKPSRSPTHRPTQHPTKRPTLYPTPKPTTVLPTTSNPTSALASTRTGVELEVFRHPSPIPTSSPIPTITATQIVELYTLNCSCPPNYDPAYACLNCSTNYFGVGCEQACPGVVEGFGACFSHGRCDNDGNCTCDSGYQNADDCRGTVCQPGYYSIVQVDPDGDYDLYTCAECDCPNGKTLANGLPMCKAGAYNDYICECQSGWSGSKCTDRETKSWPVGAVIGGSVAAVIFIMLALWKLYLTYQQRKKDTLIREERQRILQILPGIEGEEEIFRQADIAEWLIPYSELSLGAIAGAGASAAVYKGSYSGTTVAIKKLHTLPTSTNEMKLFFQQEASLLAKLNHPNVVRFFGVSYSDPNFYIITEYCETNLLAVLDESKRQRIHIHVDHIYALALSIAIGMEYLHNRHIAHRDLKSENVLLTRDGVAKICDFGLARLYDNTADAQMTNRVGTPAFMAPELAKANTEYVNATGDSASLQIDVYSFGILLWAIATQEQPYEELNFNPFQLMAHVVAGLRPPLDDADTSRVPEALKALMRRCWDASPQSRPSFREIVAELRSRPRQEEEYQSLSEISIAGMDTPLITRSSESLDMVGELGPTFPFAIAPAGDRLSVLSKLSSRPGTSDSIDSSDTTNEASRFIKEIHLERPMSEDPTQSPMHV